MAAVQPIDVAATITAVGTIGAIYVGAKATRGRSTGPAEQAVTPPAPVDPDDRPAALRERLAAAETRLDAHDRQLEALDEEVSILRALQAAVEELSRVVREWTAVRARATPRPRRPGDDKR